MEKNNSSGWNRRLLPNRVVQSASQLVASLRNENHHAWAVAALLAGCFWLYGGFLWRTYAGADFPPAVSYAMNFKIALDHGQLPPRLVEFPREFQLGGGTVDGTPPTPDAPVFQYYAFLPSALAYPFLSAGIKGPEALGWVLLLCFAVGALCLYVAALLLGARRNLALLASWSYLVSPWLISNIYARGGVAEGVSHALLPMMALGFACAWTGRYRAAVVATALGIGAMALAHNIFLLHGAFFGGLAVVFGLVAAVVARRRDGGRLAPRLLAPGSVALGLGLGLAITAWQWMPAYLGLKDTSFAAQVTDSFVQDFSSLSGIFGWPRRFSLLGNETSFFFTVGWWTVPSVLVAVWLARPGRRAFAAILAALFVAYFLLTYTPKFAYSLLPQAFTATQISFRTLAFLSLAGALALMLVRWRPGWKTTAALLTLMTASQWVVISYPVPLFRFTDDQYLKGWEVNAFHTFPRYVNEEFRVLMNGGLIALNDIDIEKWRETTAAQSSPLALRLVGRTVKGVELPYDVWLGPPGDKGVSKPTIPEDATRIDSEQFDIVLPVADAAARIRVGFSRSVPVSIHQVAFNLDRAYLIEGPGRSYVYADAVQRSKAHGLQRVFSVQQDLVGNYQPSASGSYVVEVPMVYSRFLVARQDGAPLKAWVDFNYRLNIRTTDLRQPIVVTYEIPWLIWALTACGVAGLLLVIVFGDGLVRRVVRTESGRRLWAA
ncbi:MAG: hypothetical protein HZA66_23865 [Rhodopseudomonas palustris]|uniref:Membrane protein 6-pyruvoyl-tetrahydropterin synthase-related domain-containing protein n=1 Tax=Rhodopseudomonas palustris TaxID=1076 RepID=A0A933W4U5_RHOPL|nr:hypothetical protein [Rhodopseudomonas palustris]